MDNHYHLLIQTLDANISDIMRTLQGGYANWFRFKHKLVGPLFQSRFKSVLVEDESYLVTLSSYIHLNPVRARMVENAADYRWSSAGIYLRP
jgi:putative transposase